MLTKMFVNAQVALQNLKNDERGVTAIEYAIIGVAISAIVLLVFNGEDDGGLKGALQGAMETITSNINSADSAVSSAS
ncbi:Flp family type IVb pilin [Vibrio agarivorans]|uniref:Flp family type IVb pilin n=1 Tax=Vibrio agarivorans TaxID=153622 RepID=A0ABT7Y6Q6_9VIBR|nr:Flp family type IVb pilin [Vibrio agarivorans]MDN2483734.1 Flp family type IVb pilin [Vibrio agarivorans]